MEDLYPSMTGMMLMMQQAKKEFNARPQAEQDQIIKARESNAEQERITQHIQQGICPHCSGKLIRGKKDKHNEL